MTGTLIFSWNLRKWELCGYWKFPVGFAVTVGPLGFCYVCIDADEQAERLKAMGVEEYITGLG